MSPAATFDADAARAARREAAGEPFTFQWEGAEFVLPSPREWPIEVISLLGQPDLPGALSMLLGDEQYQRFMLGHPTLADIEGIMNAVAAWSGVTPPE